MLAKIFALPQLSLEPTIKKVWKIYFTLRFFTTFYSYLIVSNLTELGDTARYLDTNEPIITEETILSPTSIVDFLGRISATVLGKTLGNLPFNFIATFGIYYSISKLKLPKKKLSTILFILSLHSFGTWTTVASKESICVFAMGAIAGYLIDFDDKVKKIPTLLEIIGLILIIIIKPQYIIAITHIWCLLLISHLIKSKLFIVGIALIVLLLDVGFIWYYKEYINDYAMMVVPASFAGGGSSRTDMWVYEYDIFKNAPYGIFIAFWGPSIVQTINGKWTYAFAFVESMLICYLLIKTLVLILHNFKNKFSHIYSIIVLFFGWSWLLLVHYPSGALNSGSALRYRENFYAFFVVLLFWAYKKSYSSYKKNI
jgi:hypothetical protein